MLRHTFFLVSPPSVSSMTHGPLQTLDITLYQSRYLFNPLYLSGISETTEIKITRSYEWRSICITRHISFYIVDDQQECSINCLVNSTDPWYKEWSNDKKYELEHMAIIFSQTQYKFEWDVVCTDNKNTKVSLTFLCEGRHFYGKYTFVNMFK